MGGSSAIWSLFMVWLTEPLQSEEQQTDTWGTNFKLLRGYKGNSLALVSYKTDTFFWFPPPATLDLSIFHKEGMSYSLCITHKRKAAITRASSRMDRLGAV